MRLLRVENVGKSFIRYQTEWHRFANWFGARVSPAEENWVIRGVNFEIQAGEAIGIIGQNGAGKSTLLKMITGILQPSEGLLQVNGRIAAILELGMGFNPDLTGRENVFHAAGLMGHNIQQIRQAIPEIEEFSEIGEYFDQFVRTYSSGMQMRVAFAVATAFQPSVLIVDEALAVGDAAFQRKCFRRIERYMNEGMALLLVSHDIESIKKLCTKAVFLKDGTQHNYGDAKEVCDEYEQYLFGSVKTKKESSIQSVKDESVLDEESKSLIDPELLSINDLSYGDGRATIEKVWLENSTGNQANILYTHNEFYLKYRVLFNSTIRYPVFSFLIKTMEGISLYGTDTLSIEAEIEEYNSGDCMDVSFRLANHLAAGTYFINCGVREEHGESGQFLHRRVDVLMFKVKQENDSRQVGLINLAAEFSTVKN